MFIDHVVAAAMIDRIVHHADVLTLKGNRGNTTFDTILVGRVTAEEMFEYWPGARDEEGASESHQGMAEKMHSYKKYVFTTDPALKLEWHNAEPVVVSSDDEIRSFVEALKARPGGDIHLSGEARLAQTFVRLGLVEEFRFFVFPVYSPGRPGSTSSTASRTWS